ncbi:LysR family transcriptional regulator [Desulfovibrio desulfuricans]|uniref:LysR family transcriptional regulator n=1 Tax=Desulfovibrio desulfuricans TaxID=876 RepID=A0A4V1CXG5_DESDE|nr:LysR family transcriptional regulator [Desulfovibrio desulfuricans]QCC86140.1 LysR family transcriptional regulator [Desulfovibrio desulfuricans]
MDLNLLIALDALLSTGSVTAAAERMGVSIPAMSRTLNRIRTLVADPVFVRAGRGLVPTAKAESLRSGVHDLILQAQALLERAESFDTRSLRKTVTIRADDGVGSFLGPIFLQMLHEAAPLVDVRFTAQGQQDVASLREGLIDLDIGVIPDLGPEIVRQRLLHDSYVIVVHQGHPLAQLGVVTAEAYAACSHVVFSRRGIARGPVDVELDKKGLTRRVCAVAASLAETIAVARGTDLVASVPERLTQNLRQGMTVLRLPVTTPAVQISQAWHPRFSTDPGHQFLRGLMLQACTATKIAGTF